jgi:hypothetical protein
MDYSRSFRIGVGCFCITLASCKVITTVPTGGKVTYQGGKDYCLTGEICSVEISDFEYHETFIAVPDNGYAFSEWEREDQAFCGGRDAPCELNSSIVAGNDKLENVLFSDDEFKMNPVFHRISSSSSCASAYPRDVGNTVSDYFEYTYFSAATIGSCFYVPFDSDIPIPWVGFQAITGASISWQYEQHAQTHGPGSLIFTIDHNTVYDAFGDGERAIVVYLDVDKNPDTGSRLHEVLGVDYRTTFMFCAEEESGERHTGEVQRWNAENSNWETLISADTGETVITGIWSSGTHFDFGVISGIDSNFDSSLPAGVVRIEEVDGNCSVKSNGSFLSASNVFGVSQ